MATQRQQKFTRSSLWESLSTPKGKLLGHLAKPKTSSPLRCVVHVVNEDPKA
jgi:hypothetical protein